MKLFIEKLTFAVYIKKIKTDYQTPMKIYPKLILLCLLISLTSATGATYKKYINPFYHFSFDVPATWRIYYSKKQQGIICVPTRLKEKAKYADCYEGIIFRLTIYKAGLDNTLTKEMYRKVGNTWYTTDRISDKVKAKYISGTGWKGIYNENVCGVSCNNNGFHAVQGECDNLFCSNGRITISLETNGLSFDDQVLKTLMHTIQFN